MGLQEDSASYLILRIANVLALISASRTSRSKRSSQDDEQVDFIDSALNSIVSAINLGDATDLPEKIRATEAAYALAGIEPTLSRIERVAEPGRADIDVLLLLATKSLEIVEGDVSLAHYDEHRSLASSVLTFEETLQCLGKLHPISSLEEIFIEGSSALFAFGLCERFVDDISDSSKFGLRLRKHAFEQLLGNVALHPEVEVLLSSVRPVAVHYGMGFPPGALSAGFLHVNAASTGLATYRIAQLLSERGGGQVMWLDLRKTSAHVDLPRVVRIAQIDAVINRATLVIGPLEAAAPEIPLLFEGLEGPKGRTVLFGKEQWVHGFSGLDPFCWEAPRLTDSEAAALWSSELGLRSDDELVVKLRPLPLLPEQIVESVRLVGLGVRSPQETPSFTELIAAVRDISFEQLGNLARRVVPQVSWQDLIVPERVSRELHWLCDRYRYRRLVAYEWGMKPGGGRGDGVSALFTGDSGTGKTLAAEVVADELGLDLLVINLSTLVDKYVGETEKNLEKIFSGADSAPGLIFFDEADSIFGKRSEVNESNDRFANIQVSYLLQRIESFNGLAILSSNLRANIDEAFMRRLDLIIDFPRPDVALRMQLWKSFLGGGVPVASDLDWDFLAKSFILPGGNIRSAASSAAYLAAAEQRELSMQDAIVGIVLEYRKLGRLLSEAEFGHWSHVVKWV